MQATTLLKIGLFSLCAGLFGCDREVSFAGDVQPILRASCVSCHGATGEGVNASGLNLEDYDSLMKGTKFGPVVVPNSSISSNLYRVLANQTDPAIQMPPHHEYSLAEGRGYALSEKQIQTIGNWIDQGAKNN
ncbi:MAG: hypothetical protein OEY74_05525 [Gammaproteobacteria bacterium]|nr:hypothetical protein [Gammaproteobacteria bacterium]